MDFLDLRSSRPWPQSIDPPQDFLNQIVGHGDFRLFRKPRSYRLASFGAGKPNPWRPA